MVLQNSTIGADPNREKTPLLILLPSCICGGWNDLWYDDESYGRRKNKVTEYVRGS